MTVSTIISHDSSTNVKCTGALNPWQHATFKETNSQRLAVQRAVHIPR